MTNRGTAAALALFLAFTASVSGQDPAAGRIKMVSGEAFVVRQDAPVPAKVGEPVFQADAVRTGPSGRVALTMKDDTRLSLGPNSEVHLATFEFAPSDGRLGFTLRILRGTLAYVSGRIARLSPESVRLETPSALVGVRGTQLVIHVDAP
jgi:hypothetical protein